MEWYLKDKTEEAFYEEIVDEIVLSEPPKVRNFRNGGMVEGASFHPITTIIPSEFVKEPGAYLFYGERAFAGCAINDITIEGHQEALDVTSLDAVVGYREFISGRIRQTINMKNAFLETMEPFENNEEVAFCIRMMDNTVYEGTGLITNIVTGATILPIHSNITNEITLTVDTMYVSN